MELAKTLLVWVKTNFNVDGSYMLEQAHPLTLFESHLGHLILTTVLVLNLVGTF